MSVVKIRSIPKASAQTNMAKSKLFTKVFEPHHGMAVPVAEDVMRATCNNSGPFTFKGTNSFIIGKDTLAVIDPGPNDPSHLDLLLLTIGDRPVSHIFVTHTHADHSPLAAALKERTGALIVGAAPHFSARQLHLGEINALDAAADRDYAPDQILYDGDAVDGDGWRIEAIETPGHTANHIAFALSGTGTVFSGDHVMAWSTSIVAPPDGSMSAYMASLDKMLARDDALYLPGHGGEIKNPKPFLRGIKTHRKMRERAVLERLRKGDRTISQMVAEIYRETDIRLHGAAGLSVFAHLEDLIEQGRASCEGVPSLSTTYFAT